MDNLMARIASSSILSADDLVLLRQYVAACPFDPRLVRVERRLAGVPDRTGRVLSPQDRLPSIELHLLKRTVIDRQWPVDTTSDAYVADLRRAVVHAEAVVWTYRYRGEQYVAFLAPNDFTRWAPARLDYVFVAFSVTYAVIRTGYQASDRLSALPRDGVERLDEHGS